MWPLIKNYFKSAIGFYTATFTLLMLGAWYWNAVHGTKFDLRQLQDIYIWLMTQLNATHAINSIFNSQKGEMPK